MSALTFDRAREEDVPGIRHVAETFWHATYRDIFTPEYITDFVSRAYSIEGLHRSVLNPDQVFFVCRDGDQVIGFCHFGPGRHGSELYRNVCPAGLLAFRDRRAFRPDDGSRMVAARRD